MWYGIVQSLMIVLYLPLPSVLTVSLKLPILVVVTTTAAASIGAPAESVTVPTRRHCAPAYRNPADKNAASAAAIRILFLIVFSSGAGSCPGRPPVRPDSMIYGSPARQGKRAAGP